MESTIGLRSMPDSDVRTPGLAENCIRPPKQSLLWRRGLDSLRMLWGLNDKNRVSSSSLPLHYGYIHQAGNSQSTSSWDRRAGHFSLEAARIRNYAGDS